MIALYIYEYLITLDTESGLFWGRKSLVSALFLLNRYSALFCAFRPIFYCFPGMSIGTLVSTPENDAGMHF